MKSFNDSFSKRPDVYLKYRPGYPEELFEFLKSLTAEHDLAWDCGTGNGQCALSLVNHYNTVYATDPSVQQLHHAQQHERITYRHERAEECSLENNSVDLITIAQTLHWFDFDSFYSRVNRVLKPTGVIAAWAYGFPVINAEIDPVIINFHNNIVGQYWQDENWLIIKEYKTIPFPFEEIKAPEFYIQKELSLNTLLGLISSWSAVQRYMDDKGEDPVLLIEKELLPLWKDETRKVTWKLILKVGRRS